MKALHQDQAWLGAGEVNKGTTDVSAEYITQMTEHLTIAFMLEKDNPGRCARTEEGQGWDATPLQ